MESPTVEGGTPAQTTILREILDGLRPTHLESVLVRPFEPSFEGDLDPPTGPHGEEILVRTARGELRGYWEASLLGRTFARRSRAEGLPSVAWLSYAEGGESLEASAGRPATTPLERPETEELRAGISAAAGPGTVERFEILEPQGHAVAIRVEVAEPHAYLRFSARGLLRCISEWRPRCDGIYAEIRDTESASAALTIGWWQHGGMSSTRADVTCCAPKLALSSALGDPGPPPCPIYG